jgi:DNA-binding response OmpR family regulator
MQNQAGKNVIVIVPAALKAVIEDAAVRYALDGLKVFDDETAARDCAGYDTAHILKVVDHGRASEDVFVCPLRLGALLDRARVLMSVEQVHARFGESISLGPYVLDITDGTLSDGERSVRLTEKERDLLLFLYEKNTEVSREEILTEVWGYSEGLDTHTLETHIYRLRQQIEADPAKPELLMTAENGYVLGFLAIEQ